MKIDSPASGNYFLPVSPTATNCCQWKQFFLQLKHIFQPILHSGQRNRLFCLMETVFHYSKFFPANGEYYLNFKEVKF